MRIPPVRFTVGRMMIAVAAVSIALGIAVEGDRMEWFREDCLCAAERHGRDEFSNQQLAESSLSNAERGARHCGFEAV